MGTGRVVGYFAAHMVKGCYTGPRVSLGQRFRGAAAPAAETWTVRFRSSGQTEARLFSQDRRHHVKVKSHRWLRSGPLTETALPHDSAVRALCYCIGYTYNESKATQIKCTIDLHAARLLHEPTVFPTHPIHPIFSPTIAAGYGAVVKSPTMIQYDNPRCPRI
jgi:hypothetical protein